MFDFFGSLWSAIKKSLLVAVVGFILMLITSKFSHYLPGIIMILGILAILGIILHAIISPIVDNAKAKKREEEAEEKFRQELQDLTHEYQIFAEKCAKKEKIITSLPLEESQNKISEMAAKGDHVALNYLIRLAFYDWEQNGRNASEESPYDIYESDIKKLAKKKFYFFEQFHYAKRLVEIIILNTDMKKNEAETMDALRQLMKIYKLNDFPFDFLSNLSDSDRVLRSEVLSIISTGRSIGLSYLSHKNAIDDDVITDAEEAYYLEDSLLQVVIDYCRYIFDTEKIKKEEQKLLSNKKPEELASYEISQYKDIQKRYVEASQTNARSIYDSLHSLAMEKREPITHWCLACTIIFSFKILTEVFNLKKKGIVNYLPYEMYNLIELRDKIKLDPKFDEDYQNCLD